MNTQPPSPPPAAPVVQVVVLNYRTAAMTLHATAAALAAMEGIAGGITIVDNDSADGSEERLRAAVAANGWAGRVQVLQAGRNGGFGAGNNVAIRAGLPGGRRPDFVYALNSDAFPERDAIAALLAHMAAHPDCGLAGSLTRDDTGAVQHSAFRFHSAVGEFEGAARTGPITRLLHRSAVPLPVPERACAVDWVAGASVLMRTAMLDQTGLFDEDYFLYYEETDLCRRAAAAGWRTWFVPESRVVHIGSVSTGVGARKRMPRYWFDSRLRYFVRHHGHAYALGATAARAAGLALWQARRAVTGQAPADPERFLRDLLAHHARALLAGARRRRRGAGGDGVPQ